MKVKLDYNLPQNQFVIESVTKAVIAVMRYSWTVAVMRHSWPPWVLDWR